MSHPSLLIAGGGTGGHVLAGVAIADAWKRDHGTEANVLFVGALGGMEEKLVPKNGYPLKLLKIGSLNRVSLSRKLKTLFQLPLSFLVAASILLKFKPGYVLGVGGYASGPVLFMAKILKSLGLLKAQVAVLEQNSVPGFTNRILGKLSDVIFAAFPGVEKRFPGKNVIVTGNPIRSSMKPMAPSQSMTVFIFGGSQGAIGINTLIIDALPHLKDLQIQWVHQTGEKDFARVQEGYQKAGVTARVEKFIYEMPAVYAQAALLICRAGSSTLAEIAAVGRASILIPLPTAADNHQEENARIFSNSGAACLFSQVGSRGEDLAELIRKLIQSPEKLREMEKRVVEYYRPHAAEDVVKTLSNGTKTTHLPG